MSVRSDGCGGEVVRLGYLKKLKTMRKKFFVLRAETAESSACLEYHDSEKKYRAAQPPKRTIALRACFNINRRVDTKHRHVIALYTKDDCFCVVLDSERDLDDWLKALLSLQHGEDVVDGEPPKPTFEHVWQVTMLNKGLGSTRNILGAYHLCFTDKTLSLVRKSGTGTGSSGFCGGNHPDHVEFSLMSIRRCGHSDCFFYMEVGRSAVTGAGELWMQTEDTNIAQNMGEVILRAMSNNNNKEELAPRPRTRSSSANEASKPILVQRRQTHSGHKSTIYCSPNQDGVPAVKGSSNEAQPEGAPSSVAVGYANISTCPAKHTAQVSIGVAPLVPLVNMHQRPGATRTYQRRHSLSAGGAVSWSGMAHHQRTQSLPLAPHVSPLSHADNNNQCYLARPAKRANNNVTSASATAIKCVGGRERCDSMPSRARTSSEGTPPAFPHVATAKAHLRPQSLYGREISHSPPAGSPVSPASAACSTDSAGSSLSIDEPDAWTEYTDTPMARYGHSLTPDEPIVEENCDETADHTFASPISGSPAAGSYVPMAPLSSDDGYVDMSPRGRHGDMSPAASSCSITSGTPSTDMRFSEYHLEKVSSYFTPSEEDDTSSAERPLRAYSVGSRPDKLRTKLEAAANHENSRVRAFSVGSRSKSIHSRVLPPHGHPPSTGGKSSSAPLLSGSHSQLGSHQSSTERMDDLMEMDFSKPAQQNTGYVDMSPRNRSVPPGYVEMKPGVVDYTPTTPELPYMDMRPSASPVRPSSIGSHLEAHREPKEHHPYVDMRPATSPLKPSSMPLGSSVSSRDSGYMDMRPSTSPHKPSTVPKHSPYYVEMSSKLGTSPKNNKAASPIQEEYMDMDFTRVKNSRTLSGAARTQPMDLPKKPAEGYMDMSWNRHQRKSSLDSAGVNVNSNNDDYMNMSSARKKERRGSKKEKNRSQPITIQSGAPSKVSTSHSPTNALSSFTSFLQNSARKNSTETPPKHPPNFLPLSSSNYSPGSSPFSSLRRPRSRKNSRRDSKDSSGLVTPTSESSTIFPFSPGSPIKPFQIKSPDLTTRKCAVDVSSGTVKIQSANTPGKPPQAGDYARMSFDFTNKVSDSDYTEMNFEKNCDKDKDFDRPVISAPQDLNYVNYCPAVPKQRSTSGSSDDYGEYAVMRPISIISTGGVCPPTRKISAPVLGSQIGLQTSLAKQLSSLTMNNINVKPCVFKPIVEPQDGRLETSSPRPGDVAPQKFEELNSEPTLQSNCRSGDCPSSECPLTDTNFSESRPSDCPLSESLSEYPEGPYETFRSMSGANCTSPVSKLSKGSSRPGSVSSDKSVGSEARLSRPSSVSSELGSTSSTIVGGSRPGSVNAEALARPPSVSSERELHYASLDLATAEDDGTRSPRSARLQETRSPTPGASGTEPGFTYAEIDFIKSEGIKHGNVKVKH